MKRLIYVLLFMLFCSTAQGGFGGFLQANTAVDVTVGPFIDDTDGKTAETGLTITEAEVFLTKNGGGYADKSEATSLSHVGLGNYTCKLDATDTNTEGILTLMIHESGALAVKMEYQILAQAAYISLMTAKDSGYMGVDIEEVDGTDQTGNDNGADINTIVTAVGNIETDTGTTLDDLIDTEIASILTAVEKIDTNTELRTLLTGSDTAVATQAKQDTIDNFIDTEIGTIVTAVGNIETDTGTTLENRLIAIEADTDVIDDGTSGLVKIAQDAAAVLVDTGTTIPGTITTAQNDLNTITGASGVLIDTDAVDADALKTDAVTEFWAKAMSDLAAGAPSATASVLTAINYIYEAWRNQTWATSTEIAIYKDDASTPLVESTISDDGTTFKREEMRAPD